jgi:P27 family predicted phage terminase small subunit
MAGARQPTALVELKGKKHFTKAELEERKNAEVNADTDNIVPPDYLTKKQAGEFLALADELKRCEIMTNLDCDALARFVVARDDYAGYVKLVRSIPKTVDNLQALKEADKLKRGAFADCNTAAKELGMTISSRCKLVVPKKNAEPKPNKFTGSGTYG